MLIYKNLDFLILGFCLKSSTVAPPCNIKPRPPDNVCSHGYALSHNNTLQKGVKVELLSERVQQRAHVTWHFPWRGACPADVGQQMVNVRHRLGLHSTLLLDRSLSGHTEKQFNEVIQINEKKTRFEWFLLIYSFPSMMLQVLGVLGGC